MKIVAIIAGAVILGWLSFSISLRQQHLSPVPTTPPLRIQYATMDVPCGANESAAHAIVAAIRDKDQEALSGLIERGKAFRLVAGTRFEVNDVNRPEGFAWGFIRSGRNVGETCYVALVFLTPTPPAP